MRNKLDSSKMGTLQELLEINFNMNVYDAIHLLPESFSKDIFVTILWRSINTDDEVGQEKVINKALESYKGSNKDITERHMGILQLVCCKSINSCLREVHTYSGYSGDLSEWEPSTYVDSPLHNFIAGEYVTHGNSFY